jgi:acetate---CoA ligase (ADP-forming)
MVHPALHHPRSIAVIGASENQSKPGGKVLKNLLEGGFKGAIYAVNTKPVQVEGAVYIATLDALPAVDLAILSIPARHCLPVVETLAAAGTGAFILFSAGFGEAGAEGIARERKLVEVVNAHGATLIGPNCVGVITQHYKGVFTTPVPQWTAQGCELISSSGATAVFLMEAAKSTGLQFSNVYSIGNGSHTGVEELLEDMDASFRAGSSPTVKLLYLEAIRNPAKFLKHSASLIRKGCRIAAIKSGYSEAGSRAASSHTGAMATSDTLIRALFRKAGIVYCSSREELLSVAGIWQNQWKPGKKVAIITHAGGSAVMLTDTLSTMGLEVPPIAEAQAQLLLKELHPGASASNPIDFLATGTAEQLGKIIDFCENLEGIEAMVVVFGSPGLFNVQDVYAVLDQKIKTCTKPIYPVLPSPVNAGREIQDFLARGHVNFPDEVVLGRALARATLIPPPAVGEEVSVELPIGTLQKIMEAQSNGFLAPEGVGNILEAAGIPRVKEYICTQAEEISEVLKQVSYPLVAKVVGPVHKTEVAGVVLNISDWGTLQAEFDRMMKITGAEGVLLQEMSSGLELFVGAVKMGDFGHLILCGWGGIYVEVMNDIAYGLAPVGKTEAYEMIQSLRMYPMLEGYRGKPGVDIEALVDIIVRLSALVGAFPAIAEVDINPLMTPGGVPVAVDARIRLEKGEDL